MTHLPYTPAELDAGHDILHPTGWTLAIWLETCGGRLPSSLGSYKAPDWAQRIGEALNLHPTTVQRWAVPQILDLPTDNVKRPNVAKLHAVLSLALHPGLLPSDNWHEDANVPLLARLYGMSPGRVRQYVAAARGEYVTSPVPLYWRIAMAGHRVGVPIPPEVSRWGGVEPFTPPEEKVAWAQWKRESSGHSNRQIASCLDMAPTSLSILMRDPPVWLLMTLHALAEGWVPSRNWRSASKEERVRIASRMLQKWDAMVARDVARLQNPDWTKLIRDGNAKDAPVRLAVLADAFFCGFTPDPVSFNHWTT